MVDQAIPPGTYRLEDLPPLSEAAKLLQERIERQARFRQQIAAHAASRDEDPDNCETFAGFTLTDESIVGLTLADEPLV